MWFTHAPKLKIRSANNILKVVSTQTKNKKKHGLNRATLHTGLSQTKMAFPWTM